MIAPAVEETLRGLIGVTYAALNNLLAKILEKEYHVWLALDSGKIAGFVITTVQYDEILGKRSLLLYVAYAVIPPSRGLIREAWKQLTEFAKWAKCDTVSAYAVNEKSVRLAEILQITSNIRFWEVRV